MSQALSQILALIPTLSAAELEHVKQAVTMARNAPGASLVTSSASVADPAAKRVDDGEHALQVLVEVMQSTAADMSSYGMLRKASQYPSFAIKIGDVIAYYRKHGVKKRLEIRAVLSLGYHLLHRNLTKRGMAVDARTIMRFAHELPSVINRAFPNYAENGMLIWVIKRGTSDVRQKQSGKSVPGARRIASGQ